MSAGLDSISATELSTRLGGRLSTELPQTLLFDHPSLQAIAGAIEHKTEVLPSPSLAVERQVPVLQVQSRLQPPAVPAMAETISMAVLEVQGTAVAVDTPFMSAGLDSIAATELANVLVKRLGTDLPQTMLFDHPTIGAVASFAAGSLANEAPKDSTDQMASRRMERDSPIPTEPE
jgi:acyl carrier protein